MHSGMKPFLASTLMQWSIGMVGALASFQGVVGFILGTTLSILIIYKTILDVQIRRITKGNLERKPELPD